MAKSGGGTWWKLLAAAAGIAAIVFAFLPKPVRVETAAVTRGPMQVTIDEQGLTGVRTRYVVATPLAGRLERVTWRPGDDVEAAKTVLARIFPADLDPRNRTQAEARQKTAEMNLKRSSTLHESAKSALEFAKSELARAQKLNDEDRRLINRDDLEKAKQMNRVREDELKAAGYAEEIAKIELSAAKAALGEPSAESPDTDVFQVTAPVSGKVLRVFRQDAGVVQPGTPIMELGDPKDLEIHVNVLSSDAVRIPDGAAVKVEGWGGDRTLDARVRLKEPAAVTGVSPLGVTEQRVKVIIEFEKPTADKSTADKPAAEKPSAEKAPGGRPSEHRPSADTSSTDLPLGDNFSVQVRIVEWESADTLQIPTSGLVREGDKWFVYRIEEGKAAKRPVEVGRSNGQVAQVIKGLSAGDKVVANPSDRVADGVLVEPIK
jgi:HlyD family secretion protein